MPSQKPFYIFATKLLGSYGVWKLAYYFLETKEVAQWEAFKDWTASATVHMSAWMATHIMGLNVIYNDRNIIADGTWGIFLADHCLAIPAVVVFALFISIYAGRWQDKLWFIPFGIICIFLINSFRIAGLAYFQKYYSALFFTFVHNYVYLIFTYGLIFLMIVWWVEVFAGKDEKFIRA